MTYLGISLICKLVETVHSIVRIKFYFIVRNYIENQVRDFEIILNNLVYYQNNHRGKQIICLFNSHNLSVEKVAKFYGHYRPFEVAATEDKVNSCSLL